MCKIHPPINCHADVLIEGRSLKSGLSNPLLLYFVLARSEASQEIVRVCGSGPWSLTDAISTNQSELPRPSPWNQTLYIYRGSTLIT